MHKYAKRRIAIFYPKHKQISTIILNQANKKVPEKVNKILPQELIYTSYMIVPPPAT